MELKLIPPANTYSTHVEYRIKVDLTEKYIFCDINVLFDQCFLPNDKPIQSNIKDGVYEYNGVQFAIFRTSCDGSHPFHESDCTNDPDIVLLNCDYYFSEDDPLDTCDVDSGMVALIPSSLLKNGEKPIDIGPVVNLNRFEQTEYEEMGLYKDSRMTFYASSKGIYVIDYFLARDLGTWKRG